jgi:hypothetical protein
MKGGFVATKVSSATKASIAKTIGAYRRARGLFI